MSNLQSAIDQIRTARLYTEDLLGHVRQDDWFRQPTEGVTHVAWQVGHLAVAQYGLALRRVRGEKPGDAQLIPEQFRELFGRGSLPKCDPAQCPSADEIRAIFDRVHRQVIEETKGLSEAEMDEPAGDPPHRMFNTKLGALIWSAQHEFIHAGQIALLRRLLGADPLR